MQMWSGARCAGVSFIVGCLAACQLVAGIEDIHLTSGSGGGGQGGSGGAGPTGTSATITGSTTSTGNTTSSGATTTSTGSGGSTCPELGDPDLVAYYPFDETSGATVHDCSGHGHDGKVLSAPPGGGWSAGHFAGGFTGDGASGCIDLGMPAELLLEGSPFTVAAWVRPKTFSSNNPSIPARYIVGRATNPDTSGWRLASDQGDDFDLKYRDAQAGTFLLPSPGGLPVNQWIHVAGTFGGGLATIYVSGAGATHPVSTIAPDVAATVRIGCRNDGQSLLDGTVDEVRIYKRAFTAAEVAALAAKIK